MPPHRVLFVTPDFGVGGGERVWGHLLTRLDRDRFDPALAVFHGLDTHIFDAIPGDVRIYDLNKRRRVLLELPRMILSLARVLRRERPVAVVSILHTWGLVLEAAKVIAGVRAPVIVNEHIHVSAALDHLARNRPALGHLAPVLHRVIYRLAEQLILVAEEQRTDIAERFGVQEERIVVIPNGVDAAAVRNLAEEPIDDAWWGTAPLVVAVGRLTPQKAFDDLLHAFRVVAALTDARLAVVGDGELREELERLVVNIGLTERVRLVGWRPNPFNMMARADVFVLSSRWEALPQVIVEALAVGAPIVSTDCPSGPRELLDGGRFGVLVPPGRPHVLGRAIVDLLNDEERRAELRARGPSRADQYDVDTMVRRYERELDGALGGR